MVMEADGPHVAEVPMLGLCAPFQCRMYLGLAVTSDWGRKIRREARQFVLEMKM